MTQYKPAAAILVLIAALGFSGCNRQDFGHDRDHVDRDRPEDRREPPPSDLPRDPPRDMHPCDRDRDPHCDDHR